ncbi:DUF2069 domain-containing protein [Halioxenophilus sp. WMMB6]|uniref:DUF2069 domain-containing protein n=1 Tax=Halioxenophilus sp. WMMB6 TaxID=3073815 RepID=UPI00295EEED5|nr:DUF2069 domain-containing protein [Halioxenophilus sp. WMMB6]
MTSPSDASYWQRKANSAYRITLSTYLALIAMLLVARLINGFSFKLLLVEWLPLLIFIPGLKVRIAYRTYSWMCFVLLAYFTAFVVELGSPLRVWTDAVNLVLVSILFCSALLSSRYTQRWQYYAAVAAGHIEESPTEANNEK